MTKFCAIGDLHGRHKDITINECDCVLICGDIIPNEIQGNMTKSKSFFKKDFLPWCMTLPCDKVFLIAGNHDSYMFKNEIAFINLLKDCNGKVNYMHGQNDYGGTYTEYNGHTIFGTPWCSIFGNWDWMIGHDKQTQWYSNLIKFFNNENIKLDILMSHDAPYGTSDILDSNNPWGNTTHCGNVALKNLVKVVQPKIMVHGHLHSTNHKEEKLDGTTVVCTSILDDRYNMKYEPYYFEL